MVYADFGSQQNIICEIDSFRKVTERLEGRHLDNGKCRLNIKVPVTDRAGASFNWSPAEGKVSIFKWLY